MAASAATHANLNVLIVFDNLLSRSGLDPLLRAVR
jgi:hypothetical protein